MELQAASHGALREIQASVALTGQLAAPSGAAQVEQAAEPPQVAHGEQVSRYRQAWKATRRQQR